MIMSDQNWAVSFYNEKVEKDTYDLPNGILSDLSRTIRLIIEFGPNIGRPRTAPLGKGLFEIRAIGPEGIARSLFCIVSDRRVIILLTATKKTNKLPNQLIDLARQRMKEYI